MLDHIGVQVGDVQASAQWYAQVLSPIGVAEAVRFPSPFGLVVGFAGRNHQPQFWLSPAPADRPGRELHVSFSAADRREVDAVHDAVRTAGSEVLHEPREWPEYHPGYYAVFFRDLDGNNIEAVHHGPAA